MRQWEGRERETERERAGEKGRQRDKGRGEKGRQRDKGRGEKGKGETRQRARTKAAGRPNPTLSLAHQWITVTRLPRSPFVGRHIVDRRPLHVSPIVHVVRFPHSQFRVVQAPAVELGLVVEVQTTTCGPHEVFRRASDVRQPDADEW